MRIITKHLLRSTFVLFITFTACNSSQNSNNHMHETVDTSGKEYTSTYICPMHCEGSGSEEPGTCPVCKMDYVLNEDASTKSEDTHTH